MAMYIIRDNYTDQYLRRYDIDSKYWLFGEPLEESILIQGDFALIVIPQHLSPVHIFESLAGARAAKKHLEKEFIKSEGEEAVDFVIMRVKPQVHYQVKNIIQE